MVLDKLIYMSDKENTIPIPRVIDPPISVQGTPDVKLRINEFQSLVYRKGYPCYHDIFIPCPCKEKGSNSARVTCKNCFGSGWVLVKRVQTVAMFQSMNFNPEYADWSIENIGTVSITSLKDDHPKFMDRYVLYTEEVEYAELIFPIYTSDDKILAFCDYPPIKILDLRMFQGDDKNLLEIDPSQVTIDNEGRLDLTSLKDILYKRKDFIFKDNTSLTIRYTYNPSYHVIDITRNIITSPVDGANKEVIRSNFPYHAVGRLSHLVLERGNLKELPQGFENNLAQGTTIQEQMENKDVSKEFCATEELPKEKKIIPGKVKDINDI